MAPLRNLTHENAPKKQTRAKFIGGSKTGKMDTSFLRQTVARRDLLEDELKQKVVSFKH